MKAKEFYKYYIPALIKALKSDDETDSYSIKGPEHYLNLSEQDAKAIDLYLESEAGNDSFLDKVSYYFDAKSHNFSSINGVNIEVYKKQLENDILLLKKKYQIL